MKKIFISACLCAALVISAGTCYGEEETETYIEYIEQDNTQDYNEEDYMKEIDISEETEISTGEIPEGLIEDVETGTFSVSEYPYVEAIGTHAISDEDIMDKLSDTIAIGREEVADDNEDEDDGSDEDESEKQPEPITRVSITTDCSVASYRSPIYKARVAYGNVMIGYEGWIADDGKVNYSIPTASRDEDIKFTVFETGMTYRYKISICAKGKDYFLKNTKFFINGTEAKNGVFNTTMDRCTFSNVYAGTAECFHEYETIKIAATCTAKGRDYRKCKYCGEESTLQIYPALGHKWELDEEDSEQATCTEPGRYVYVCVNDECEAKKRINLPALGHAMSISVKQKATGSKAGCIVQRCTRQDCDYDATTKSVKPYSKIKLSKSSYTYNGNAITPGVKVLDSAGKEINRRYYSVSYSGNKNTGKATVKVKFSGIYSGSAKTTFKINKATSSIKVAGTSYTVKKSDVKKKSVSINLGASAKTKLKYSSSSKHVTVKGGTVTVKKGTPKGTYTITIESSKSGNYKGSTKKVKIKVK